MSLSQTSLTETSRTYYLLDSICHAADNELASFFSLSRPQCCIRHNWLHHSPKSSHFQFRHHGFLSQVTTGLSPISLQRVFLSHFWLLFLYHITFILLCSKGFVLGPILFIICLTYCFNCILSIKCILCQSTAICWRYTAFCLPFPFLFI